MQKIKILQLPGTEAELYRLVAPLVMNPVVLRKNLNFPFRTSEKFIWWVAVDKDTEAVLGFVPVENKRMELVINNYYVADRESDLLHLLIDTVVAGVGEEKNLSAVSFIQDMELFASFGFKEEKRWTNYAKMVKAAKPVKEEEENG